MQHRFVTMLGKSVKKLAETRGGGSALPGLFVEKIDPRFIERTLEHLPRGVILISGTNGKTTTTKMVVELLESQGLRVFTNRTGSNFTRGVAAALLGEVNRDGELEADIAVLELDEAHAVHFVKNIKPAYCLLLNVMRDQLDRFGEIDTTAKLLRTIAENTTDGVVVNRDDPRLGAPVFIEGLAAPIRTYGVAPDLLTLFPSDDNMREGSVYESRASIPKSDDVSLEAVSEPTATIRYGNANHDVTLKLKGVYNILNATGAVALTRMIMGRDLAEQSMLAALEKVTPAFGRGETLIVDGKECELVLVKNPSGFRLSLKSFNPADYATMIAINDNYADGRDMSWLWDVDFDSLQNQGVAMVSGVRAYDMALRLQYDEVEVTSVEPLLPAALAKFINAESDKPKRIFCTYTAMLAIRRELSKKTNVEVVR
jgi:UDP-N-acetylmuramyl tripeptide synthase